MWNLGACQCPIIVSSSGQAFDTHLSFRVLYSGHGWTGKELLRSKRSWCMGKKDTTKHLWPPERVHVQGVVVVVTQIRIT